MLDRTQAPAFQTIDHVAVLQATSRRLANGIGLHCLDAGGQPVIRLEYIFAAGSWYEPRRGVSYFLAKMLPEGTRRRTAADISAHIDQFGSFLETSQNAERLTLTVYTLARHLPALLPLLHELLAEPAFPEHELDKLKTVTRQNLQVNLQKTSFLAQHRFRELLFGENHPYGRYIKETVIAPMHRDTLAAFHAATLAGRAFEVVLCGQLGDDTRQLVETHLAGFAVSEPPPARPAHPPQGRPAAEVIARPDSLQSSIRVGRRLLQPDGLPFSRRSRDYFGLTLLNEVLGGYFGSRLMKNIREEKGFTYGIHSSLGTFRHEGFLAVGTDVKREFTKQTLDEIRKEMRRLQAEPVPEDELQTVKNYLVGAFAGSVNTPFSLADHFKTIHFEGLDYGFFDRYVTAIAGTTAEDLMALAAHYLDTDGLTEVVAGGRD